MLGTQRGNQVKNGGGMDFFLFFGGGGIYKVGIEVGQDRLPKNMKQHHLNTITPGHKKGPIAYLTKFAKTILQYTW